MTPTKKKKSLVLPAVLGVVVIGAAAGAGGYFYLHDSSPLKRADALLAKGDVRAAQIELRNAVRNDPGSAEAHLRLAQAQALLADPVAAEKEFKSARDLGADRWVVIPQLGQVYMAQNRFQDVLTEIPPEGPTPDIAAKNLMLRSMAQVGLNDIPGASATLALAEKAAPRNGEVLLMSARLAVALRDFDTAEKKVDEALKQDPNSIEALLVRGQVLMNKGDKDGALAMADKAVALEPNNPAARLDRANQYMGLNQDAKAQEDVTKVLALQPKNAGATYLNGVLLVRAGRYADAQVELSKLGQMVSRFPRTLYFQALSSANLGQTEAAVDYANRYLVRLPADPEAVRLVARTELAAARPERAVTALTKAIADGRSDGPTLDLLGRAYAAMGKQQEAVEAFRKAVVASPNDPSILTHLASSEMQLGDASRAAQALDRSLELAPKQPNAGEALVAAALSAGDLDKAEQALAKLRAEAGETESVGILSGMVRLARLDLDGARQAFLATLKQFPDSSTAKLNLAKVLVLQGRRQDGENLMREILQKDPANIPALNTLVQLMVQSQQFPQAIQIVEAARQAQPRNAALTATQADLIVRSGDPRRAVAMLQAMRNSEELQPSALAALGRAQAAAGLNDEAKNTFRDLIKAVPNDLDARRAQVDLMLRTNDPEGARASLREALSLAPGNMGVMSAIVQLESKLSGPDAGLRAAEGLRRDTANLPASTVLKGDALMEQQKYPDAAAAFGAEYKLQPSGPLAMRLANALAVSGKNEDASKTLLDWQGRNPEDPDTAQMLGLLDMRMARYDDAERNLNIVLAKRPSDPVAMNNLAWIYQQKNDPRARALAQRAYLQAPSPETGDTLGWIMATQGDSKTALPLLQQAMAQRPQESTIKYHVAYALNATGQKEEAIKLLEPLVAAPATFDDKPAARKLLEELKKK